jgi:hypothetical protein
MTVEVKLTKTIKVSLNSQEHILTNFVKIDCIWQKYSPCSLLPAPLLSQPRMKRPYLERGESKTRFISLNLGIKL